MRVLTNKNEYVSQCQCGVIMAYSGQELLGNSHAQCPNCHQLILLEDRFLLTTNVNVIINKMIEYKE